MTDTPDTERTAQFWDQAHADDWEADSLLEHPLVQTYMSIRAFGGNFSHMDMAMREIARRTRPGARILSVGCGGAVKERVICARFPDREIVGMDIATEALARTRELAHQDGLTNLELVTGDFNRLDLEPDTYDMILGLGAVHHVENLEGFWEACRRGLKPGGAFLAQEYVGPSQFQWTERQVELGNEALRRIPERFKAHHAEVHTVPVDVLVSIDPSEAVRSAEILSTCRASEFEVEAYYGAGAGLLHPVLVHQTHTFDPNDWTHNRILFELFETEAQCIADGLVGDNYATFVAV